MVIAALESPYLVKTTFPGKRTMILFEKNRFGGPQTDMVNSGRALSEIARTWLSPLTPSGGVSTLDVIDW